MCSNNFYKVLKLYNVFWGQPNIMNNSRSPVMFASSP